MYDVIDGSVVILASAQTPIPTNKNKVAFFRHKPGRIPYLEAAALARHLGEVKSSELMEL